MAEFRGKEVSWKQLWQLLSGIHYATPRPIVADKLADVADQLRDGILSATPDTQIAPMIRDKATLLAFSTSVEHYLGLTAVQASNVICSYLINEYKGSPAGLLTLLATDQHKQKLLVDIAKYFALERLVLLKIVRNLLELHPSRQHPYGAEYTAVLRTIGWPRLLQSYIAQLEHLIGEPLPSQQPHTVSDFSGYGHGKLVAWAERRNRETIEVLHVLLLLLEHAPDGISAPQIGALMALFRRHSFGRQQPHLDGNNAQHVDLVNRLIYSEVAVFVKCCSPAANRSPADTVRALQAHIPGAGLAQHAEHGPVLLAWMLLNVQASATAPDATFDVLDAETDAVQQQRIRQCGSRAIQLDAFEYLRTMCAHPMHNDGSPTARIVRRSVFALLGTLCDAFDADGSVATHPGVYGLLAELLRTPALAREFCARDDGARSLWHTALEHFPVQFVPLSELAEALASSGTAQQTFVRQQLDALPIYAETLSNESPFRLRPSPDADNEFVLLAPYAPFAKVDFDIAAGTTAVVQDRPGQAATIHFRTPTNYFNALHHELNELLAETLRRSESDALHRERRVRAGIRYLAVAVRHVTDPLRGISSEMVHPTEMVFDVLNKFKAVQQPPIELLARCLEVCTNLVPLFEVEIVRRVVNLNVLPFVTNARQDVATHDYRAYCHGTGFESGLVGHYLINFEKNCGRYAFLRAYLDFLHAYARLPADGRVSGSIADIELPGLIFVLREVLPHAHGWHFERDADRQAIFASVFRYLLNVLQASDRDGAARVLLRSVCVDSLLNLDNGMVLLRFIAIGNDRLQSCMQNVSNWMSAAETGLNQLVQLAMTTLMQILRLRNRSQAELSPLESIIYTQPKQRDTLRIIPMVTSYMGNIFNRRLPLLACRLLRRFAIEFQMSMLACLDMEPDQIRLTFLARLPDELESEALKMAVVEFVEACIQKQPGLTEAFFRIRNERRYASDKGPRPREIGDGILTYMTQYLRTVAAEPERIASPLLGKILALFHALWKNNMQTLVQELQTGEPDFWSALCKPLFVDIQPAIPAYAQLFNMLGIEVFRSSAGASDGLGESLQTVLRRFFEPECLRRWVDGVLDLPRDTVADRVANETPEWLCRLQSFKDFVVLAVRRPSRCPPLPVESLRYFAEQCLRVLVERSEYMDDIRPFVILAELYLLLLLTADGKYTRDADEDDRMLGQVTRLFNQTASSYRELQSRSRESVLTIALRSVVLLAGDMRRQPDVTLDFMRSAVDVLCVELQHTEALIIGVRQSGAAGADAGDDASSRSFVLALNLLQQMSTSFAAVGQPQLFAGHWTGELVSNRIVNRLLSCLNAALPVHRFRRVSVVLLDVLIDLAQGTASAELLHSDIVNYLWMRLLPPREMLQIFGSANVSSAERSTLGNSFQAVGVPGEPAMRADGVGAAGANASAGGGAGKSIGSGWQTNDWWPIYARGIRLVTVLLQQHRHVFAKDALMFVGVHEEYVVDAVMLAKHTMDGEAVVLIKTALLFVCELVRYEKQWRLEHSSSLINLMRSVQSILDHSVSLLFRPKILLHLLDKASVPSGRDALDLFGAANNAVAPSAELMTAMNDLIEVVTICSRSLLAFSPKVLDMIVEPQFVPSQWQPLVEIQFGAPKLYVGTAAPQLTFGTVLSAVAIFTKALQLQNYAFSEQPINRLAIRPLVAGDSDDGSDADADDPGPASAVRTGAFDADRTGADATPATNGAKSTTRTLHTKSLSMTSNTSAANSGVAAGSAAPPHEILTGLDVDLCRRALEFVLTLLCSQSLLALKDAALSVREKQLIKRELSSELAGFHDLVRKRIMSDARGPLHRRKRGVADICALDGGAFEAIRRSANASTSERSVPAGGSRRDHRPSMREAVMRQQFQLTAGGQQTPHGQKRPSIDLSPIAQNTPAGPKKSSTPLTGQQPLPSSTPIVSILSGGAATSTPGSKRVTFPTNPVRPTDTFVVDDSAAGPGAYDATVFVASEDVSFTGLSLVQMVDADYLHLLSLVFMHICQHD